MGELTYTADDENKSIELETAVQNDERYIGINNEVAGLKEKVRSTAAGKESLPPEKREELYDDKNKLWIKGCDTIRGIFEEKRKELFGDTYTNSYGMNAVGSLVYAELYSGLSGVDYAIADLVPLTEIANTSKGTLEKFETIKPPVTQTEKESQEALYREACAKHTSLYTRVKDTKAGSDSAEAFSTMNALAEKIQAFETTTEIPDSDKYNQDSEYKELKELRVRSGIPYRRRIEFPENNEFLNGSMVNRLKELPPRDNSSGPTSAIDNSSGATSAQVIGYVHNNNIRVTHRQVVVLRNLTDRLAKGGIDATSILSKLEQTRDGGMKLGGSGWNAHADPFKSIVNSLFEKLIDSIKQNLANEYGLNRNQCVIAASRRFYTHYHDVFASFQELSVVAYIAPALQQYYDLTKDQADLLASNYVRQASPREHMLDDMAIVVKYGDPQKLSQDGLLKLVEEFESAKKFFANPKLGLDKDQQEIAARFAISAQSSGEGCSNKESIAAAIRQINILQAITPLGIFTKIQELRNSDITSPYGSNRITVK